MNSVFTKTLLASSIALACANVQANTIVAAEAYIDNPAIAEGSGTPISITNVANLAYITGQLDVSALADGVHIIYTRTQDAAGTWSAAIAQVFETRPTLLPGQGAHLTAGEYFFDNNDLGAGANSSFPVFADQGMMDVIIENITLDADVTGLSPGVHAISVRVKNGVGTWSPVIRQMFYRPPAIIANNIITAAELFIGSDPGQGLATAITAADGSFDSPLEQFIKTGLHAGLAPGVHTVGFRSQDSNGEWSATLYQRFELLDNDADGINDLDDLDDDNDTLSDVSEIANGTNPLLADSDGDSFNDNVDVFPLDITEWLDSDSDGSGNNADSDDDDDGVLDVNDAFPLDATESVDTDGDGTGDNADSDDDGDGVLDVNDAFPLDATESVDTDGDGIGDNSDATPGFGGDVSFEQLAYAVNEADVNFDVRVVRRNGSQGAVSVTIISEDDSAVATSDYGAVSETLSFIDGETEKLVNITLIDDAIFETTERFGLKLLNPMGDLRIGADNISTVTVSDNDISPDNGVLVFSSGTYSYLESDGSATVSIMRIGGSQGTISVDLNSIDGSAQAAADFQAVSQIIDFAPGETQKEINLTLIDDADFEADETFSLQLDNPVNTSLSTPDTAIITIRNDDAAPAYGVFEFLASNQRINEAVGTLDVEVQRSAGSDGAVSVRVEGQDGSAIAGTDYELASSVLNFADTELSQFFTINILDDAIYRGERAFSVVLSNATNGAALGNISSLQITIDDDDTQAVIPAQVSFSGQSYQVNEADLELEITLIRSANFDIPVDVDLSLVPGSALAGQDYVDASPYRLSFPVGVNQTTAIISLMSDDIAENTESFSATLTAVSNNTQIAAGAETVQISIIDDDLPPEAGRLRFASANYQFTAASASTSAIVIQRANGADGEVSVEWSNSDARLFSGTENSFSGSTTGVLVFADNQTQRVLYLANNQFLNLVGTTGFNLEISNPTAGAELGAIAVTEIGVVGSTPAEPDASAGGGGGLGWLMLTLLATLSGFGRKKKH